MLFKMTKNLTKISQKNGQKLAQKEPKITVEKKRKRKF